MYSFQVIYKYLFSFLKTEWDLEDYPVQYLEQDEDEELSDTPRWSAQIINWWVMTGHGENKQEAYESLRKNLLSARDTRDSVPRPGTFTPVELASNDELNKYRGIVNQLLREILNQDPEDVIYISDETSLLDFSENDNLDIYFNKIKTILGVDVSHIKSGNIAEISKYISENHKRH